MEKKYKGMKFHEIAGYYEPAFFKLFINTKNPIDPATLNFIELGTFVHEYTHFLQDFSTIYGLINISSIIENFRFYSKKIHESKDIDLPLEIEENPFQLNEKINKIAFGTFDEDIPEEITAINFLKQEKIPLEQDILDQYPELKGLKVLKANAVLENGLNQTIEIGSLAVIESMAAMAERLMGFDTEDVPNYPYNVVPFMARVLCPDLAVKDDVLFALCDCVLQCSSQPGPKLYDMMVEISSGKLPKPNNGYDVYHIFAESFSQWHCEQTESWVNIAKKSMFELVGGQIGEQYQEWVTNLFKYTIDKRKNEPEFLLRMCLNKSYYAPILNEVGSPMLFNDNEDYTKVPLNYHRAFPVNYDVEFFMAWQYVMDVCQEGRRECPLLQWCTRSQISVDKNCIMNPPLRSRGELYDSLCPIGAYWRHKDLSNYSFDTTDQRLVRN